jgi:uncharacterized low-complexity protein
MKLLEGVFAMSRKIISLAMVAAAFTMIFGATNAEARHCRNQCRSNTCHNRGNCGYSNCGQNVGTRSCGNGRCGY